MRKCHNWIILDDARIQCQICPHNCVLKDGQTGYCRVRRNVNGQMQLITYGKCSGLSIDPIEKKPLYHFLPGSKVLSLGTNGCNLGCQFCQNWTLSRAEVSQISFVEAGPEEIALKAKETGCQSVAFTYNEPIIFTEYAEDIAEACHQHGIKTVVVSAGYINSEPRARLFEHVDAANIDLKSFNNDFYRTYCDAALQPVLDTLLYLRHETDVWLEITTLLINGLNDSDQEIQAMTAWIADKLGTDIPLHFSAFHGAYKMQDHPTTSLASLRKAKAIAESKGFPYVYIGNIIDADGSVTRCAHCQTELIRRDYFRVSEDRLIEGRCPSCQTACPGVFTA